MTARVETALFMFIFALGFVSFHCWGECWVRATPWSEPVFKWAPGTWRDLSTNSKFTYEICLQSYTHWLFSFALFWREVQVTRQSRTLICQSKLWVVHGTSPPRLFKALRGIENSGCIYTSFEYHRLACAFVLPIPLEHVYKCGAAVLWNITDLLAILISFFFSWRQAGSATTGRGH